MHPRSNTFLIDMDSLTSLTSLPEVTRVINYPWYHPPSATVPLKSFVMLLGSSQFTTAFNLLNSFAVPLIGTPFNSLVVYVSSPLFSYFHRLAVLVVSFSIKTFRIHPARLKGLGIPRTKKDHICRKYLAFIYFHDISNTYFTLRDLLKFTGLLV